jgi:hypothetical protein
MDITNVGSCQIYGHYEKGGRGEGEIEGERERERERERDLGNRREDLRG